MDVFQALEKEIVALDPAGRDLVARALEVARLAHAGQTRGEGEYLEHPVRVALILLRECSVTDPMEIAAALCHDVLENSQIAAGELGRRTDPKIAEMVAHLTKDPIATGLTGDARTAAKTARDNRYFQLIGKSALPVRRIKCADRLDNLRARGKDMPEDYAAETRIHLLPIAHATDAHLATELDRLTAELSAPG